jgi:hypothetical protein
MAAMRSQPTASPPSQLGNNNSLSSPQPTVGTVQHVFKYELSDEELNPPLTFEPTDVYEFVDDITNKQEAAA